MPELRQNYATKEWVIIASERARRPSSFIEPEQTHVEDRPRYDARCPFCPGNEELDLEVARYPTYTNWQTRVVRNKFPALSGEGPLSHTVDGVQHRMAGIGFHEVVVNHPHHNTTLALMQPWEIQLVLETLQHRGLAMAQDPRIQQVILFKNHGKRAGASLEHSHCQVIGMPVVPETVRRRSIELQRHYEATGEDPIQVMAEDELNRQERLVTVSDHFVGFVLYAALSPFHMWVVPRTKRASFLDVPQHELADLAGVLRDMMLRLHIGLNDPSYNIIIRSSPVKATALDHFHWYISIVPRLSFSAGFELGSGMYINPSLPEASADFLRHVAIERVVQQA